MSLWTTLSIIGGSTLLIGVIAVLAPGVFSAIVNILRSIVEFVVEHLPKPLKYILVIVLVGALGSVIFTYTVGLTHVCLNDGEGAAVYKVPMFSGLLLQTWQDIEGDVARVDINPTNILEQEGLYSWETVGGVTSFMGLVVRGDLASDGFGSSDVIIVPPKEQFGYWFSDTKVKYSVCYDSVDESCVLMRSDWFGGSCSSGGLLTARGSWTSTIGTLTYEMHNITKLSSNNTLYDGRLDITFDGPGIVMVSKLNDCSDTQGAAEDFGDPVTVHVVQDRWLNDGVWDFKVYNAEYFPLMRTQEAFADVEAGTFFFDIPEDVLQELINEIIVGAKKVESQRGSIMKFQCERDTEESPFDTKMTVFGINLFQPTVLIFFFVFAGILSVYKYFKQ